jgi:hypothetical protein
MELSAFITETLNSITKGIKDSQSYAMENGALINPILHENDKQNGHFSILLKYKKGAFAVTKVEFDIAVSVGSAKEQGVGAGITVFSVTLGANKNDAEKNETISKIKFSVNAVLPASDPNSESSQL